MPSSKRPVPDGGRPVAHACAARVARRSRLLVSRFLTSLTVAVIALAAPAAVSAHAELVLASPAPGTGLAQAPAAVVMKFSEPLNLSLSRIEVLDASGADVGQGPTQPVTGDAAAMRRPLGLLPTGQYTVRWTTVSQLDGHTLRGSYFFAVGTDASADTTLANSPLDSEGPLGLVGRFVALVALGAWLASALLRGPSGRAALDPGKTSWVARAAPVLAFAGTGLSLASATFVATGSLTAIGGVLASPSGTARLVVLAATAAGVLVGTRSWRLSLALAAVAIVGEASSGHAASSVLPLVGIPSFAIHLAAAGVWTYAIVASLVAAPDVRRALATFTPYAVAAGVAVAASGIVNATLELADPGDLVSTPYGNILVAKSFAFVLIASYGLVHYVRRRRPATQPSALRGALVGETTGVLFALVAATLLVGFPNPPREAAASDESLTTTDPVLAQLGQDALTLGDASGPYVVGLTILPPAPGPVELRVQVLGVDPGDALRSARVDASSGSSSTPIALDSPCGVGCFSGKGTINAAGDWRLAVHIDSNRGPISITETVPLPASDGTAELARALGAEEGLRTARLVERLSGSAGGPTYVSTYTFQAPDRARISLNDSTQILIGETQYRRTGQGPWEKSAFPAPGFSWPSGFYREFWQGATAVRVIGHATVDGVPTEIVSFFRPDVTAWFRIWVGLSDGLVRRQEMRAEGHIMDHTYSDLDGPLSVQAPP